MYLGISLQRSSDVFPFGQVAIWLKRYGESGARLVPACWQNAARCPRIHAGCVRSGRSRARRSILLVRLTEAMLLFAKPAIGRRFRVVQLMLDGLYRLQKSEH